MTGQRDVLTVQEKIPANHLHGDERLGQVTTVRVDGRWQTATVCGFYPDQGRFYRLYLPDEHRYIDVVWA